MNARHTPGPWRVSDAKPTASRGIDILSGYNKTVASVPVPKYVEHNAPNDARLIAAAPELLEALCVIASIADAEGKSHIADIALAAIAKARGEA